LELENVDVTSFASRDWILIRPRQRAGTGNVPSPNPLFLSRNLMMNGHRLNVAGIGVHLEIRKVGVEFGCVEALVGGDREWRENCVSGRSWAADSRE
jgi:hypothetical protein